MSDFLRMMVKELKDENTTMADDGTGSADLGRADGLRGQTIEHGPPAPVPHGDGQRRSPRPGGNHRQSQAYKPQI